MTVQIHTPTINEIYQAKWNLESTGYLTNWSVHLDQGTRPLIDALKMWNFEPDTPRTPESLLDDYVELNPLAHVRPVPESFKTTLLPLVSLESPGDLLLDDDATMTVLYAADENGNPVEPHNPIELCFDGLFEIDTPAARVAAKAMMDIGVIPLVLREPDIGVYYMVSTEEIDGKKYSYFRPCHPSEKPKEGETLERFEKPLRLPENGVIEEPNLPVVGESSLVMKVPGSYEELVVLKEPHGPKNFQFKY